MKSFTLSKSSKKIFATILVLNVVILAIYLLLFSSVKQKNEFTSILEDELKSQVRKEANLKLVANNLEDTEEERMKLNSYFVKDDESGVVEFIEFVEGLADESNVELNVSSLTIEDIEENVSYKEIMDDLRLNLNVEGSWSGVVYFLELLGNVPYKITFDKVYLEKVFENPDNQNNFYWTGEFRISVMKLKPRE